jgi:hypothetical protein
VGSNSHRNKDKKMATRYDLSPNIPLDLLGDSVSMIDYQHAKIHDGRSFICSYTQTVSDTNDKSIIAFKTGTGRLCHMVMAASATAAATAYVLEAPTIADNAGTGVVTVYNRYRDSTNTSEIIDTYTNPDTAGRAFYFSETDQGDVTGGTTIASIPIGAVAGPFPVGGRERAQQEYILKANTLYAFVVNSSTDDDNIHWIELDWYECSGR